MQILIIGASGLVGGCTYNYFEKQTEWKLTGTYNQFQVEPHIFFNASAPETWPDFILNTKWDIIIHTGALTNVDKCEENPELSNYLTVASVFHLTNFSARIGAKLVYISTDYVFDGKKGPYIESDKPNPINIYGQHKLAAENIIQSTLSNYLILRVTNVYGTEFRNKNFVSKVISQIQNCDGITIQAAYDQFATPVSSFDIAKSMLLLLRDCRKGIYHIASTDYMSRVQLLQKINYYFGNKISIEPLSTKNLQQTANRPLNAGLKSYRFLLEYPHFNFSNIDNYLLSLKM